MESTRFPGKVQAALAGEPMLHHVVRRARLIWPDVPVWVFVPVGQARHWPGLPWVFEGHMDPLARYADFALSHPDIQTIVRLTGDCPLLDPGIARFVLQRYYAVDRPRGVFTHAAMDGLDMEIVDASDLVRARHIAYTDHDREHVTPWLRERLGSVIVNHVPTTLRWSVDTPEDLAWVEEVYQACDWCAQAAPHHTNAKGSIGGDDGRRLVVDLHHRSEGDLVECRAADLLSARMGGPVYVST